MMTKGFKLFQETSSTVVSYFTSIFICKNKDINNSADSNFQRVLPRHLRRFFIQKLPI